MSEEQQPRQRTRVQRPDQTADQPQTEAEEATVSSPTGGEFEADQSQDDNAEEGPVPMEAARATLVSDTMNFEPPFRHEGTQVKDNAGRVVCFVGSAHLTQEAREKTAEWIAFKLSHPGGIAEALRGAG
jgi:hypothetical protein